MVHSIISLHSIPLRTALLVLVLSNFSTTDIFAMQKKDETLNKKRTHDQSYESDNNNNNNLSCDQI